MNPDRELEMKGMVGSVMKTLVEKNLKKRIGEKLAKVGSTLEKEISFVKS